MRMLPQTRSKDIVVQNLNGETLIYDIAINKAYCLNETAAIVYNACNESKTFAELTQKHKLTEDLIHFALDELHSQNLLQDKGYSSSIFDGMNRREVIKKVGLGSMLALPVITTLLAPKSAAAASCRTQACTFNNFTQSDCCNGSRCNNTGVCLDCLGSGTFYRNANDLNECNTSLEKNLCCNTGSATFSGTSCFCP